jgi:hypothetical protein
MRICELEIEGCGVRAFIKTPLCLLPMFFTKQHHGQDNKIRRRLKFSKKTVFHAYNLRNSSAHINSFCTDIASGGNRFGADRWFGRDRRRHRVRNALFKLGQHVAQLNLVNAQELRAIQP